ncbi:ethanolamine ammonia-lyase large subunit [Xanthomonas bromi]|uniref:Ethanolamine ammonia-lyase large subunit n=1 Tax=Xanthomonas bromi TaxID=56449 RepID=A0A1C3NMJ5_9XANT|nr:ethanolamine ammonia-lyase large subunit [Xanthomonas bromi]
MVAAVSKVMRVQDLLLVAQKTRVVTRFRNTLGLRGRLSTRLQPNHPTDDATGIAASVLDGLLYGNGDAVINPASDSLAATTALLRMLDAVISGYQIPTQSCVLAHITTTIEAIGRGVPGDLVFQSIAGTEAANTSFGINLALLQEGYEAGLSLRRGNVGDNVMYFETGQGSALSANAHHGVDQQTCEVRAYAVARHYKPLLVNTVVGFMDPEYFYDGKQIIRAGLEDHFCGKLLGVPIGCDICYTNHAEANQDDMDMLLTSLGTAGINFIMGIPGSDDVMLNYQTTSFHDALYARQALGLRAAPEFEQWLEQQGILQLRDGRFELGSEVPAPFRRALAHATAFPISVAKD